MPTRRAWHGWCVAWLSPQPSERAVPVLVDCCVYFVAVVVLQAAVGLGELRAPAVRNQ